METFIVTGAQKEAGVHRGFRRSLEHIASDLDARIIVLPMPAHRKPYDEEGELSRELFDFDVVTAPFGLNKKIRTSDYQVLPQQIDPVTGLARFTQTDVSTIFSSPKQRLKVVPNSNVSLPKVLLTTGAITQPQYQNNRIGRIARQDHVLGAVIVETEDDRRYHFRHVRANSRGSFVDLGVRYDGDQKRPAGIEAMVLGDLHPGETDPLVREANFAMIREYAPRRVVLHDTFNGSSVNPHEARMWARRAMVHRGSTPTLVEELELVHGEIDAHAQSGTGEVIVVKSNHDEFLDRYLEDGRFMQDPQNAYLAAKLFVAKVDGADPLVEGLALAGPIPHTVRFLKRDEDYKVRGWQLGSHGDRGPNGGKGSIRSKETSEGRSITGHTHTPEILRDTIVVGTSTYLKLPYTVGPSSWMNTNALLYDTGTAQLVNIIDGAWRAT